jgi:ATP-binding cassette subfamily B protein
VIGSKLQSWTAQWPYLVRAMGLVWTAARRWTAAWLVVLIVQGTLPVPTVYLTRSIVNAMIAAVRTHGAWDSLRPLLIAAGLLAAVLLAAEALRGIASRLRMAQADLLQDYISGLIQEKSATVDLAFYESPKFYDHLHRARDESTHRPTALVESIGSLLQNCVTLVALVVVLIPFGIWLPVFLLLSAVPALYVVLRYALLRHHWQRRATTDERWSWYYDWLLTASEPAAEIRLFALREHFRTAFDGLRRKLRHGRLDLARAQSRAELAAGLSGLLVTGGAVGWMGWRAVQGLVSLGDLALFYQALQQAQTLTRSLLDQVGQLYQNSLFLGNLFEFLSLEPQVVDPATLDPEPAPLRQGIRFRNVTFRYPGMQRPILEEFDLWVPAGQVVTIVGPNGAGKSTLIKLLCRFYDPQAGSIEWDGVDLRSLPLSALRNRIAALFQVPVHYNASVAKNIAIGDLSLAANAELIETAARAAGADAVVRKLPGGYDSLLGNWFEEGTELSVGEWQRIGLARVFLRASELVVFDEPTSAMDPWAEAEWLARFRQLIQGRTAVVITHRFTTAKFADVIHVLSGGRIVESGSHEELLKRNGLYAAGWSTQAGG